MIGSAHKHQLQCLRIWLFASLAAGRGSGQGLGAAVGMAGVEAKPLFSGVALPTSTLGSILISCPIMDTSESEPFSSQLELLELEESS